MATLPQHIDSGLFSGSPGDMGGDFVFDCPDINRVGTILRIEDSHSDFSPATLAHNFSLLLDDFHYEEVMEIFDVSMFNFTRRKQIKREFRALCIALWRLALLRSFPGHHDEAFQEFMERDSARFKNRREYSSLSELTLQYVDKLQEHGDADFSEVSRHLLSLMEFDETRTKAMILKLALYIRKVYVFLFDNLV